MFRKHFITLLMATAATAALAFTQLEDDAPQQVPEPLQTVVEGGKLFIINDEGEKREIDVTGARSIMIRQSNKMFDLNGEQQTEVRGNAIIIGPDGEKTVIELNSPNGIELPMGIQIDAAFDVELPQILMHNIHDLDEFEMPNIFRIDNGVVGNFMIGVHCAPADDSLRSHLRLDDGIGLVVRSVSPGAPAGQADLKEHDVLLYADDTELRSTSDLTAAVEAAGEEERTITMTLFRQGVQERAELSPAKRPENALPNISGLQFDPGQRFQFQQMGPGIIVGDQEDMSEIVNRLRDEVQKMREDMKQMMERDK